MDKKTLKSLKMLFLGDALIRESYARENMTLPYQDTQDSQKILKILEKALDKQEQK